CQACFARFSRRLLAENSASAERLRLGKKREKFSERFGGNDRASRGPQDGLVREDSARKRANDSARSSFAGGSQCVSTRAACGFAQGAGGMAGRIVARTRPPELSIELL